MNGTGAGRETHVPVLIVGGGPVGLALAIELGRLDVDCLVVEQIDGGVDPKTAPLVALTSVYLDDEVRERIAERGAAGGPAVGQPDPVRPAIVSQRPAPS